jgi:hypothetical protein
VSDDNTLPDWIQSAKEHSYEALMSGGDADKVALFNEHFSDLITKVEQLSSRLAAVTAENADLRKKLDQNEAAYNEGYMIAHAPRRRIDVDGRDVTDEAGLWCETDHFIAADAAIRKDDINLSNCQKCGEFMGHGHVCPTPTKARTA